MDDILQRIFEYQRTYAISARGHYLASARQARRNYGFGVPSVVISAMVGASIFGTIKSNPPPELGWKIAAGLLSLSAAVLVSLQTFFRFGEIRFEPLNFKTGGEDKGQIALGDFLGWFGNGLCLRAGYEGDYFTGSHVQPHGVEFG